MRAPLNPIRPPVARAWLCKFDQEQKEVRFCRPVTRDVVLTKLRAKDAVPLRGERA